MTLKGKKKTAKHKLETQDLSWCPVLKDALNLGSQSNLSLRTWSIQWWMCFSRLHPVSMGLDEALPLLIAPLPGNLVKRYADLPWISLEIKNTFWEKKQEYPYFWKGYSPAQNLINGCSTLKSGSCNIVENWSRLYIILCTDKILILRLRRKKLPGSS